MSLYERAGRAGVWLIIGVLAATVVVGAPQILRHIPESETTTNNPSLAALAQLEEGFAAVAEKVEPSVVSITAERTVRVNQPNIPDIFRNWPFGGIPEPDTPGDSTRVRTSGGSGVIVRGDGYILTNDHVVGGADKVTVTLFDGREFDGEVFRDSRTDLAIIKINANNLPAATLADSTNVRTGAWAIALGSPLGFDKTLTVGVISALEREIQVGNRYYPSLIQTDASINPGNSGGPLMNLNGEVIGINVAIASPTGANAGIGFAIPSNTAQFVLEQLIETGKVSRGYLGVVPTNLTPAQAEVYGVDRGAFISSVSDDTPAAEAGMQVEDVVVRIGNREISSAIDLRDTVARTQPGSTVDVEIVRNKQRQTLRITIGELEEQATGEGPESTRGELGLTVRNITSELRSQYDLSADVQGVVVTQVAANSAAARAEPSMTAGDVIVRINGQSVSNVNDFNRIIGGLESGDNARIIVRRGNSQLLVSLRIP